MRVHQASGDMFDAAVEHVRRPVVHIVHDVSPLLHTDVDVSGVHCMQLKHSTVINSSCPALIYYSFRLSTIRAPVLSISCSFIHLGSPLLASLLVYDLGVQAGDGGVNQVGQASLPFTAALPLAQQQRLHSLTQNHALTQRKRHTLLI